MQALLAPASRPLRPAAFTQRAPTGVRPPLARRSARQWAPRAASSPSSSAPAPPSTAKEAVERGLEAFGAGDTEGALALFLRAQQLSPNADEACAACYNAGAAPADIRRWLRLLPHAGHSARPVASASSMPTQPPSLPARSVRPDAAAAVGRRRGVAHRRRQRPRPQAERGAQGPRPGGAARAARVVGGPGQHARCGGGTGGQGHDAWWAALVRHVVAEMLSTTACWHGSSACLWNTLLTRLPRPQAASTSKHTCGCAARPRRPSASPASSSWAAWRWVQHWASSSSPAACWPRWQVSMGCNGGCDR